MENKNADIAKVFKAFCDENRITILHMLQSGEKCACILLEELAISQSTLSHHMKILVESGVVKARREGKWTHYSISEEGSKKAEQWLIKITAVNEVIDENQSGACQVCR
ncbi:ArsR/SmtB family transcription factor [Clostridium aminobutyricum]|uniref:Winged helix-turn-helix transcriptional regulator n=1 Tax=Clostridium aminobutyricum TaxID=33953 RepID=A0A939D6J9_CLOAM|nr:metalloregulator ArsR/SmtB family transcription factor [Clostridium aminobutyricum]MBN7772464.1 winged helix-turn-helix transcriptional regulator [Clostridium aminobutyricum]